MSTRAPMTEGKTIEVGFGPVVDGKQKLYIDGLAVPECSARERGNPHLVNPYMAELTVEVRSILDRNPGWRKLFHMVQADTSGVRKTAIRACLWFRVVERSRIVHPTLEDARSWALKRSIELYHKKAVKNIRKVKI